jgi:hypothetical protein
MALLRLDAALAPGVGTSYIVKLRGASHPELEPTPPLTSQTDERIGTESKRSTGDRLVA